MEKDYKQIKIEDEIHFFDKSHGVSEGLRERLDEINQGFFYESIPSMTKKLEALIKSHKKAIPIRNYLFTAYCQAGKYSKARALNKETRKLFPEYIFGYLEIADLAVKQDNFEDMPNYIKDFTNISKAFPFRESFTNIELQMYLNICCGYHAANRDIDNLELIETQCEYFDVDEDLRKYISETKLFTQMKVNYEKLSKGSTDLLEFEINPDLEQLKRFENFTLKFPEIEEILELDFIAYNKWLTKNIQNYDRHSIIKDVLSLIQKSIFEYHIENKYTYEDMDFVYNCFFTLGHLKAKEISKELITCFQHYTSEYCDIHFGDLFLDRIPDLIQHIFQENMVDFFEVFKTIKTENTIWNSFSEGLIKYTDSLSENRSFYLSKYKELLQYYISLPKDSAYLDSSFMSLLMWVLTDYGYHELLPEFKTLFEKDYLDVTIMGNYKEVEAIVKENKTQKIEIFSLQEIAEDNIQFIKKNQLDRDQTDYTPTMPRETPQINNKLGRNDPCHCGSGKKYKKCCL